MIGNATQYVGKPGLWIDAVEFCRSDEGVHRGARSPHRPGHPDYRLLVTYGQIARCEYSEQLAVPPQIEPIISLEPSGLNDNSFRHSSALKQT